MKKIFLILAVLVSLNALSTPNLTSLQTCKYYGDGSVAKSCVNKYFSLGYEIIGTTSFDGTVFIQMAKINR